MNYKKLIIIPLTLVSLSTFSLATIYSDGEDGTVGEWNVHDNKPSGATISNIVDNGKNSNVIEFKGSKRLNTYIIGAKKGNNAWNNSEESKIRWSMNFAEKYKITVYVTTKKGSRVLFYNYKNSDKGLYKTKYIKFGLGSQTSQGNWVNIERDLKADLAKYEPDNELLAVQGFKVQGSGKIDNLELYNTDTTTPLEISNIHFKKKSDTYVKVYWNLNERATGQVEYGTTTDYGLFSKKEESFKYRSHRQSLRGLEPNTIYHYKVISEDKAGHRVVSGDKTFSTGNDVPCISSKDLKYKIAHKEDVTQVNTSCIKDMSQLFTNQEDFNQDISHWDVSNVTNMNSMFWNAHSFNQNLANWDVSNVKDMGAMFAHAVAFNQNIGKWNVSNVKNMNSMFWGKDVCLDFNQDITHWNVSNVTNMELMFFQNCYNGYNFKNHDLSNWNVKNVTKHNIFFTDDTHNNTEPNWEEVVIPPYNEDAFVATWEIGAKKTLQLSGFDDGGTTPYKFNFHVEWGDGTSDNVKWDVSNDNDQAITHNYNKEGSYSVAITGTYPIPQGLCFEDIDEDGILEGYQKLTAIEQWGTQKWKSMRRVFWECKDFNSINDPKAPDFSEMTDMNRMFKRATKFNQPIGHWDVSNVTNMSSMFEGTSAFNQDLSGWDIRKINKNAPDLRGTHFSTENYDKALKAWSKLDVKLHVMWLLDAKFSANASAARAILDESWNIRDGGMLPQ